MFDVQCVETCQGDNGVVFEKGQTYTCMWQKDIIAVVRDKRGRPHIFYKKEFETCFKPLMLN